MSHWFQYWLKSSILISSPLPSLPLPPLPFLSLFHTPAARYTNSQQRLPASQNLLSISITSPVDLCSMFRQPLAHRLSSPHRSRKILDQAVRQILTSRQNLTKLLVSPTIRVTEVKKNNSAIWEGKFLGGWGGMMNVRTVKCEEKWKYDWCHRKLVIIMKQ